MVTSPSGYDEWLALTDEEREDVHFRQWNVYARDGIAIAYMAAARLAMQSTHKILEIQIGTHHGAEYLLHLTVSPEDFENCPPKLEQTFEGFRVVWFPDREYAVDPVSGSSINGRWIAAASNDDYEFEIHRNESGVAVSGSCRATNQDLLISNPFLNDEYVLFTAYHPTFKRTSNHAFKLIAADRCEDHVSKSEYYVRTNAPSE